MISMIPNLMTLLNLFSGCMSIVFVLTDEPIMAITCLGISLGFDFLDGLSARILKQNHPLGGDLDSLADVVSFGVAPGVMYYQMLSEIEVVATVPGLVFSGFIFTLFGAYRLARFNVDHRHQNHFSGLPIPSAAIFVVGLFWLSHRADCETCTAVFVNPYVLLISIIFLSFLMVSDLPHFSLKMKNLSWKGSEIQWIYLALVCLIVLLFKIAAVSISIVVYVFTSLIYFSFAGNKSE